jgi:cell wall-associated NlpC family hydrolase
VRCGPDLTAVRAAPARDAEQVTQLLPGEPIAEAGERVGEFVRIRTVYDYGGWVAAGALEEGEGRLAPDRDGAPLQVARLYLGAPYLWGGMSAGGIDCSGLVHMAYRRSGRLVPRDARDQDAAGVPVEDPVPGDLVTYGEPVDHVAFWLGGGRILHSTGREGGIGVVEEVEPAPLRARRRRFVRL